jgi:hypothetical protein
MNLTDIADELKKLFAGAGNTINQGAQNVSNFVQQPIKIAQQGIQNWASQPQNYQKAQALQTWQPLLQPIQTAQRSLASQGITNLPQFATKVMGNAPQQFNQYVQNVSNQAKLPQVIPSVVGSMGKTIMAGPSTLFQKKSNWEHAGDVLGTVGAVTNPFNSLTGGVIGSGFQAIMNTLNKQPITQNLDKSFSQGVDFSSKLGPISEATNWALGPILSKLNPTGMQSWNTYINLAKNATSDVGKQRALMALTNAIIGQLGQKTITGLIGMGAYGATMPAKDLNERLGNFIDNAVQGAGYEVGGHILGQGGNIILNQAKDIKLQNRPGFVKIAGDGTVNYNSPYQRGDLTKMETRLDSILGTSQYRLGDYRTISGARATAFTGLEEAAQQNVPGAQQALTEARQLESNLNLARNEKNGIPQKQSFSYKPATNIPSEQKPIETAFYNQLNNNFDQSVQEYKSKFGNILNTDNARELSPHYNSSNAAKSKYSVAVHEPASAFVKEMYARELATPDPTGNNMVVFTAGGTGAGKTTAVANLPEMKDAQIVYDTNMNTYSSAKQKIDQAIAAGKDVSILYVNRDPIQSFDNGAVPRALRTGRTIPIAEHANTHSGAIDTIKQLAETYKDNPNVSIKIIDNTGGKGQQTVVPIESIANLKYNKGEIQKQVSNNLDTLYANKQIPTEIYQGFKGQETQPQGVVGKNSTSSSSQPSQTDLQGITSQNIKIRPSTPQGGENIKIKGLDTSSMPNTQQPQVAMPQGNTESLSPNMQSPLTQDNKSPSTNVSSSSILSNSTPLNNLNIQGEQPKGFVSTVKNAPGVLPEVKSAAEGILPQTQQPITNKESFATAQNRIDTQGIDAAHQYVLSNAPYDAEKAGTAQLLMKQYAENIKAPGNYEKFQQLTDSIDQQARTAGQGIQSLSNWDKLSPKAILNVANASADKLGQTLPEDFQKQVISRAADIQKMTEGSPERTQAVQGLLKDIADQLPSTKGELFDAYRYMNMLSGPVTVEKIGYGGLFNTLVTRPIDLFAEATTQHAHQMMDSSFQRTVSYSDIPQWYKDAYLGMPDAWNAALQGWKQGNVDKAFQEGQSGQSTINKLRQQNLPDILTLPGKAHGFVYNFFSSIIGGAERSRLMANGVDEATATKMGQELGDKFTLRSPLGGKDQSTAVKAVDGLGQLATKMQDIPVLGTFSRWIAPFMKVSTNFVKLGVEHSPLALPDSAVKFAQGAEGADANLAHAMVGSLITGLGAMAVAKDMVTGAAPTDKKQSDLFYASGRKPYSVNIPGVGWTPYQYFGPLGLSLMLPQAVKDATSGVNATKDVSEKVLVGIGNTTKMIIAGTPLPSITGFFNMLAGDTSVNPNTFMADMTSQLIPFEAMQRYVAQIIDPIYRKASSYTDRLKSGIPDLSSIGLPSTTKSLQSYTTPLGQPETRNATNFIAPYAIGQPANQYEPAFQSRQNTLNSNAIINQANKNAQSGGSTDFSQGGIKISSEITKLPDGTFSYQITDSNGQTTINQAKTQKQAQLAIDKNNFINSDKETSYSNGILYTKQPDGTVTTKKIDLSKPIPPPQLTGDATVDKKLKTEYQGNLTTQANDIMSLYKNGQISKDDAIKQVNALKIQSIDITTPINTPQLTGNTILDKKLVSQYQSELTSRANDIVTMYQAGQLTQSQATSMLTDLQNQSSAYKAPKKPKKITIAKFKAPKISTAGFKIAIAKVAKPPAMPKPKMTRVKAIKISQPKKITLKK